MARKSGFVRRNGVMRRETVWFGGVVTSSTMAAASTSVLITSLNAVALDLRPFTVIRSRGVLAVTSDQTGALEAYQVSYGAAVVSDQSVAIGVTAIPTPDTDNSSDLFFIYETLMGQFTFISGIGVMIDAVPNRIIDSKAARKVEDGQDVVTVCETSAISSGANIKAFVRMLVKLH